MRDLISTEVRRLKAALQRLDVQTVTVLVVTGLLVIIQNSMGSRRLFRQTFRDILETDHLGLFAWGYWFVVQGVTGFVIPVLILLVLFRCSRQEIGLGRGDWKFASIVAAVYLPLVVVGTWFLSASPEFQSQYPHYQPAARDWTIFLIYEGLFLFYWIGWEYLWRGFMLFGTARTFGLYAIVIQALPFALLHLQKPLPETVLSLVGGIALGALVWRARSFWIAVPIHAAQMMILDLWCTFRIRTEVDGVGLGALLELLRGG